MNTSTLIPLAPRAVSITPPRARQLLKWIGASAIAIALTVTGMSITGRAIPEPTISTPTLRTVTTVTPTARPASSELILPAQLLPYEQATMYARIDGYVTKWHVDRGARVRTGDILAEIDAPELDQQTHRAEAQLEQGRASLLQLRADLEQAKADLESGRAQVKLAEANSVFAVRESFRNSQLVQTGAISRSDADQTERNRDVTAAQIVAARADLSARTKTVTSREAAIVTQEATIRGLESELQRLRETQKFKKIVAPFDGTVTRRHAEVGMLVSTLSPQPLFHVQNSATLRVQVDVPQAYAVAAKNAKMGQVLVPELPGKPLDAKLARTANALDPTTRTLRIELELPNEDRAVFAGTYTQVRLTLPSVSQSVQVPTNVLRYTPGGVEVVLVNDGVLDVRPVKLGRDYGRTVEILIGLTGRESLVVNPSDDLLTGERVSLSDTRP